MSYLINDELIWVSVPKCASMSIENALKNSKLKLEKHTPVGIDLHYHVPLNMCYNVFGKKESICITRDWFSRWLSALNWVWDVIEYHSGFNPICKWEDIDNEFIYKTFNSEFCNHLHQAYDEAYLKCFAMLIENKEENLSNIPIEIASIVCILISQKYYKDNLKCTYEFDIKDMDKFVDFIENKFGEKLIIENKNVSTKRPNKIIINDELKEFVWNNFEKIFEKKNNLI